MRKTRRLKRMSRNRVKITKMNLTSLMDVFTILVFFLLVNSGSVEILDAPKDVALPESIVEVKPSETIVISISADDVMVDGRVVGNVAAIAEGAANHFDPLTARLSEFKENVFDPNGVVASANHEITIMADKSVPFIVVRKIMSLCTGEGFDNVSLAVVQKASRVAAN